MGSTAGIILQTVGPSTAAAVVFIIRPGKRKGRGESRPWRELGFDRQSGLEQLDPDVRPGGGFHRGLNPVQEAGLLLSLDRLDRGQKPEPRIPEAHLSLI